MSPTAFIFFLIKKKKKNRNYWNYQIFEEHHKHKHTEEMKKENWDEIL